MERRRFNAEFKRAAVRPATPPGDLESPGGARAGAQCDDARQVDPGGALGQVGVDSGQTAEDRESAKNSQTL
jgi:hypothetical protein